MQPECIWQQLVHFLPVGEDGEGHDAEIIRREHKDRGEPFDCTCHGSRFSTQGTVIEGPTLSGLETLPHPK